MPETSSRRHQVPAESEHPSREGWVLDPLLSVNDIIPVANPTDRAIAIADLTADGRGPATTRPVYFDRRDTGFIERTTDGTTFQVVGGQFLGEQALASQVLAAATWADVLTVTATTTGRRCVAHWDAVAFNGSSGASRTISYRVLLDGSVLGPAQLGPFPALEALANGRVPASFTHRSTPAAGSHTWKLQAQASAAAAVYVEQALLTVDERP